MIRIFGLWTTSPSCGPHNEVSPKKDDTCDTVGHAFTNSCITTMYNAE